MAGCGGGNGSGGKGDGHGDTDTDSGADGSPDGDGTGDGAGDGEPLEDAGPGSSCGDGIRHLTLEECDDGNVVIGDGCDDRCDVEPGYNCAAKGGGCAPICGDSMLVGEEGCDDGNTSALDGCDQSCQLESGWACPTPGELCTAARCGDGMQVHDEECDDSNQTNGDGCDKDCAVEPGWICVGSTCSAAECGDAKVAGNEVCDDGNLSSGDGCLEDCSAKEPFFVCPPKGGECTKTTVCGDGNFTADEQCDDGNDLAGDGCAPNCTLETGYICPDGMSCNAQCGDGLVVGDEQCDDNDGMTCKGGTNNGASCELDSDCAGGGNCGGQSGDGCDSNCQLEEGFDCEPGQACTVAVCGNDVEEGLEECDDTPVGAVDQPYDGCFRCKTEPSCTTGACQAVCGDGVKLPSEACDDGNTRGKDGCNEDCSALEPGFLCEHVEQDPPNCVDLPLILRDFKKWNTADGFGHPDFDRDDGDNARQIVRDTLGYDGNNDGVSDATIPAGTKLRPIYAPNATTGAGTTHGAAAFNQWYDDSERGKRVNGTLRVCDDGSGTYVFDDRTFYPVDGQGWQNAALLTTGQTLEPSSADSSNGTGCGPANTGDPQAGQNHNFGFTSEVRFWFTFKGGEELTFRGDDDVWVFIAGKRVIDLGGVHCAQEGTVVLQQNGDGLVTYSHPDAASVNGTVDLNLVENQLYEVVVYQAERHTSQSSYRLELGKFFKTLTECEEVCGDGVRTRGELCDSGSVCVGGNNPGDSCLPNGDDCDGGVCTSLNDGAYGHCTPNCRGRGLYCGDATKTTPPEQCDLGAAMNDGSYDAVHDGVIMSCNPDCTLGPACGDGNVDGFFGEQCDNGAGGNVGGYNGCTSSCVLSERCGDNEVQADEGEECDDGVNLDTYDGCAPGCVMAPFCGDGMVQAAHGEQCDLGTDKNKGGYGGCEANCRRAAFCGDGETDKPQEQCDDGNSNNFDGCSSKCKDELVVF